MFSQWPTYDVKRSFMEKNIFKVQHKPMKSNKREFKNFIGMIWDSTLQLTFRKPVLTVMPFPWLYYVYKIPSC